MVADTFQGQGGVSLEDYKDDQAPVVSGSLKDLGQVVDVGLLHKGLNPCFGKRMRCG